MRQAYIKLHIAVFLFGFTAILGALINMNEVHLVWWRVLITTISLALLFKMPKRLRKMPKRYIFYFIGIGFIVAVHWMTFFGAIKASNASITLVCLATASFWTSLIEPFLMKTRFSWFESIIGILVVPGMMLIMNETTPAMQNGIYLGLISAVCAATFSSLNKKLIQKADPYTITFLEMAGAWLLISFIVPFWDAGNFHFVPIGMDWVYLMILALVCTTFAYVLNVQALLHLTAFASNLVINLEPVYGILLAIFILKEHKELTPNFYIGVAMIIVAVFLYPVIKRKLRRRPILMSDAK